MICSRFLERRKVYNGRQVLGQGWGKGKGKKEKEK